MNKLQSSKEINVACYKPRYRCKKKKKKKKKTIPPLTGRGGLWGCEMLRIPHSLVNRLTDGGKISAILTGRALLPINIIFLLLALISVRG
jgi:hypothetical protein